ncbi:hypothetical protein [Saccharibacillus kuerlensis]|uniref:Uncharacterized protein n=1 Tax=Saccharibacillus kuerlensis TaxID=459527 RepID=A0ABQ2L0A9_9BACL|nr:hypothetical protein [Saccharibacillus kuerlensis]GGN98443.1 hypothetical protein GCM10010969_17590 [Saccharibacillus kuerlensis]
MPIMPINNTGNIPRIIPVQPVSRPQTAGFRSKLPGTDLTEMKVKRRQVTPGRRITVREEGWIREYGVLPDGTRILISEQPERSTSVLPLPREKERVIADIPETKLSMHVMHDPERSMEASAWKLKSLLKDQRRSPEMGET